MPIKNRPFSGQQPQAPFGLNPALVGSRSYDRLRNGKVLVLFKFDNNKNSNNNKNNVGSRWRPVPGAGSNKVAPFGIFL